MRRLSLLALLAALPAPVQARRIPPPEVEIDAGGRVFTRAVRERVGADGWQGQLLLDSARLEVSARTGDYLKAVVEIEAARGDAEIRDAYVRFMGETFAVRAGRFKAPAAAIDLASEWDLPVADRGLVSDVLDDRMQIGGRRPGLEAEWSPDVAHDPVLRLGAYAASDPAGEALLTDLPGGQTADLPRTASLAGRVEIGPRGARVGLGGELRQTCRLGNGYCVEPDDIGRYWSAVFDATLERRGRRHAGRIFADVQAGSHWYAAGDDPAPRFLSGRVLGAWRRGGLTDGALFVEAYAGIGAVDPDRGVSSDVLYETSLGLAVGIWDQLRVSLEAQLRRTGAASPTFRRDFLTGDAAVVERDRLLLHVGAAF